MHIPTCKGVFVNVCVCVGKQADKKGKGEEAMSLSMERKLNKRCCHLNNSRPLCKSTE